MIAGEDTLEEDAFETEVSFDLNRIGSGILAIMVLNLVVILVFCALLPLLLIPAVDVESFLKVLPPNTPNLDAHSMYLLTLSLLALMFLITIGPIQYLLIGARSIIRYDKRLAIGFCLTWFAWNGSFIYFGLQGFGLNDLLPLGAAALIALAYIRRRIGGRA